MEEMAIRMTMKDIKTDEEMHTDSVQVSVGETGTGRDTSSSEEGQKRKMTSILCYTRGFTSIFCYSAMTTETKVPHSTSQQLVLCLHCCCDESLVCGLCSFHLPPHLQTLSFLSAVVSRV